MPKVKGLDDPPDIFREEKTTIKNGVIMREHVWKDTDGNELERVSDNPPRFSVKKSAHPHQFMPIEIQFLPKRGNSLMNGLQQTYSPKVSQDSSNDDVIMFVCFALIAILLFFLGYVIGNWWKKEAKEGIVEKAPARVSDFPVKL